jgi:hypothetical protein
MVLSAMGVSAGGFGLQAYDLDLMAFADQNLRGTSEGFNWTARFGVSNLNNSQQVHEYSIIAYSSKKLGLTNSVEKLLAGF